MPDRPYPFGKGIDGRPRSDEDRIVGTNQPGRLHGDLLFDFAVDGALDMHADILHQRIDRTGTAVRAVEQVPALQKLHILADGRLGHVHLGGHIGHTNESVTIQRIENILTAFGNTQHDLIFSIPRQR